MSDKYQQLLIFAESFIKKELPCEKVREYERLKRKLEGSTPTKNSTASSNFFTSNKKTQSRQRIESHTQRKTSKSISKRTIQTMPIAKSKNQLIQNVIIDLGNIREKILRKQYSRKTQKQIILRTTQSSCYDDVISGQIKLCLQRIILALDIQTLKIKEQMSKNRVGDQEQLGRVHKDNKWLIQQIQSVVEENQKLKSQGAGFIKHNRR